MAQKQAATVLKGRAVFLDRDGVIIDEVGYVSRPGQMRLLKGAAEGIARLNAAGLPVVVVSNQSAVGRGLLTRRGLETLHRHLRRRLERKGASLNSIFYCPHLPPEAGGRPCACRKPGTALFQRAARRFKLRLSNSFMVGDSTSDVQAARNAGCRPLLVRTGKGGKDGLYPAKPERVFRDLRAAAAWICRRGPVRSRP